jgi:hydroxyacylglutathione hydrolase
MEIDCLELGDFMTNCYVIRESSAAQECLIIDPGYGAEPLVELLQSKGLRPGRILLTHGHCDHIAGIKLLKESFETAAVCISGADAPMLTDDKLNLTWMTGDLLGLEEPEETFTAGDTIGLGGLEFKVLPTPGHTPGGVSFYCAAEGVVFVGDALFSGSIGRTDFPGGDTQTLLNGVREQLFTLPEDTRVYTGHGSATTIGVEKSTNPFF